MQALDRWRVLLERVVILFLRKIDSSASRRGTKHACTRCVTDEWYQRASFALWRIFASLVQSSEDRRESPREAQHSIRS